MEFVASRRAGRRGNRQRIRRDERRDQPPPELCTQRRDDQRCPVGRTKFYENGEQRRFEAVFVNHTVASGENANEITSRDTKFGIGFIETGTWSDPQNRTMNQTTRVFLERR